MRLGEILVEDGILTVDELESALRAQAIYGGRLGTNLVEQGLLDLETLSLGLGKRLGVPAVPELAFNQITPGTLALFPTRMAEKHQAVPLELQTRPTRRLSVVFIDPHQLQAIDELGFIAGARITPLVAPELRVLYLLEKHYAVLRKNRFLRINPMIGNRVSGVMPDDPVQFGQPGYGRERRRYVQTMLPPAESKIPLTLAVEVAVPLDLPKAPARPAARAPAGASSFSMPEAEPINLPEGIAYASTQPQIPQEQVPTKPISMQPIRPHVAAPPVPAPLLVELTPPPMPAVEAAPPAKVLSAAEAIAAFVAATSRDHIGQALVDYMRTRWGCALALICRDQVALGWQGFAAGVDPTLIESIALPLVTPSMFATAYESRAPFHGPPPAEGISLQARLWKLLRCSPPREVVVVPIVLKERVVALLYSHTAKDEEIPPTSLVELTALCAAAASGFANLIQRAKQSK